MDTMQSNHNSSNVNVAKWERWTSALAGGALMTYGLVRHDKPGMGMAALGAGLLYRGSTGHCPAYQAAGIRTAGGSEAAEGVRDEKGIKVKKTVTINKTPEELYAFWRRLDNLPQFMEHLESVTVQDSAKSHWVAKAPLGRTVEWDAEIINDIPNELIAWRSLPGADVDSAGSVTFKSGPAGRGTEVHVSLSYQPPMGQVGATVAKLFGEEPNQQIENDLRHFKNIMETGEMPTIAGQPAGARNASAKAMQTAVEAKMQ